MPTPDSSHKPSHQKVKIALGIAVIPSLLAATFYFSAVTYATSKPTTTIAHIMATPTSTPNAQQTQVLSANTQKPTSTPEPVLPPQELLDTLAQLTTNNDGTHYAISIHDLKSGQIFGQNGDDQTHAASVMKTLVAATALSQIEKGTLTFDTPLSGGTVRTHLKRMINRSDNNSWDAFYAKIGTGTVQAYAQELGMTGTKIDGNLGTANDFAHLLELFYTGKIGNEGDKKELFSYMQNTETENLLTLGIPKQTPFYHKTGKYSGGMHDAMIVDLPNNPFIIVVLSSNDKGYIRDRSPVFKRLAATVYDYFAKH